LTGWNYLRENIEKIKLVQSGDAVPPTGEGIISCPVEYLSLRQQGARGKRV
jgi:hypothetical protein